MPYADLFFDQGPADVVVQIFVAIVRPLRVGPLHSQPTPESRSSPGYRWHTLTELLHLREPSLSTRAVETLGLRPTSRSASTLPHLDGGTALSRQRASLKAAFVSLGSATGEAFDAVILNDGDRPLNVAGDAVVLESVSKGSQDRVRRQLQDALKAHAGKGQVAEHVDGYCLEYLKAPPEAGRMYRLASPDVQAKYANLRHVLQAEERLEQLGRLVPDMDPKEYFHQLRQWALWSKAQGFTSSSFGAAFIDHARKNFAAAKQPWTRAIEAQIASLLPHRWQEIVMVMQEADKAGSQ
jgi:hypothetical protein